MRFSDFDYRLMKKLNDFIDTRLRNDGHAKLADTLNSFIIRKIKAVKDQTKQEEEGKISEFDRFPKDMQFFFLIEQDARKIAEHLTYIDFALYRAIQSGELIDHQNSKSRCTNMAKMIDRFNSVSNWVSYLIVSRPTVEERISAFVKFLEIAFELRKLNNFNGLLSFIGGVSNSAVYRLKHTREGIPGPLMEKFDELRTLMNAQNSYKIYRETLHSISPPVVPYVGMYLQDLTFINDGNPNNIDGLINFRKRVLIYRVIEEFQQYQQASYQITPDKKFLMFVSCIDKVTEEELMGLSKKHEP